MMRPLFAALGALALLAGWLAVLGVQANWQPAAVVAALADSAERSHLPGLAARGYLYVAELDRRRLYAPETDRSSAAARALIRHIIDTRMAAARLLLHAGYREAAESIALEGARANFDDVQARALLLEIRLRGDEPEAARRELMLLALKRESPQLLYLLGTSFARDGQREDAAACYERALLRQPDYLPALLTYARLQSGAGRPEAARELLRRAGAAAVTVQEQRTVAAADRGQDPAPPPLIGPLQVWWREHSVTLLAVMAYLLFLASPALGALLRRPRPVTP